MERTTITLTDSHHALVMAAIEAGEYTSVSEVIRDAIRDWEFKRQQQLAALESLRSDLAEGRKALEEGRVSKFDPQEIMRRGRERLAAKEK